VATGDRPPKPDQEEDRYGQGRQEGRRGQERRLELSDTPEGFPPGDPPEYVRSILVESIDCSLTT
jgi:hypothetical protein